MFWFRVWTSIFAHSAGRFQYVGLHFTQILKEKGSVSYTWHVTITYSLLDTLVYFQLDTQLETRIYLGQLTRVSRYTPTPRCGVDPSLGWVFIEVCPTSGFLQRGPPSSQTCTIIRCGRVEICRFVRGDPESAASLAASQRPLQGPRRCALWRHLCSMQGLSWAGAS